MKFLLLILFSIYMISGNAQEIISHQWENRLLLILSEDSSDTEFKKQIKILKENRTGLDERKLVVYQILPGKYKKGIGKNEWQQKNDLYNKYKSSKADFEVILIGLDGGKKLQETKALSVQTIFSTIDAMPMRKAEMRKKGNN